MDLFSHYAHAIKHRRRKVYAQNLLPCLLTIGKRKEQMVIETLTEFMKSFSKNLLNCLTDGETIKLVELFLNNLEVECAIKRRSAAQNIIIILEHSTRREHLIKSITVRVQENLSKARSSDVVLGSLGLLRLIMQMLASSNDQNQKILEILETCLNFLKTEPNHSIVNANLEVLNALLATSKSAELINLLTDNNKMIHKEMLLSKRSMSAFINLDSRKSSDTGTLRINDHLLQVPSASTSVMSTPNKSLMDFSDVEGDSFNSIDFEAEVSSSPATSKNFIERGAETMSLKSTDSINSFFNSIASNTETVSKFFRKSSTDSPGHHAKTNESEDEKTLEFSINDENNELPDSQTFPDTTEAAIEELQLDSTLEIIDSTGPTETTQELYIGTIFDQSIVEYIVRLVASKFLLEGTPNILISDQTVRVSIKNLALSVIAGCVELKTEVLMMKLQKNFTDESMMVETLLSFLIDEDLRLEEEEKKKKEPFQEEATANASTSESFLEIKDDHFGECTTATFLDYFSPLSKSLDDQGLISLKNRIYEEKSKDREESAKKINRELCQLLSRSEIVESKNPTMETTLKMPEDKDCQFLSDVLLFSTHSDPVLRGNVCMIAGSFIFGVLKRNLDYSNFTAKNQSAKAALEFNKLKQLIINGLGDEIHTVVKQSLLAFEESTNLLISVMSSDEVVELMDSLLLVFFNKYWLVQCKYCDVITKIDLKVLGHSIGVDAANAYEVSRKKFLLFHFNFNSVFNLLQKIIFEQIFELIRDGDFRVRSHASSLLPTFINQLCETPVIPNTNILKTFVDENVMEFEGFFVEVVDRKPGDVKVEQQLSRVLYTLSNFLMDIKDKNQSFGTIYALKILSKNLSPLKFPKAWKEFNVLGVLQSFSVKNPDIASDVSCQCDMIEVIATLIAANGILNPTCVESNEFLHHLMKILNIYGHLVTNTKPLIVPKQKSKDIFTSSKEQAIINSLGFFSCDYIYLKLYVALMKSHENSLMVIKQNADEKLKQLLSVTLKALQTLLELKTTATDLKMVEEAVLYLKQLIAFQPAECIVTMKILFKFLFQRNYANRRSDLDEISSFAENKDAAGLFKKFETFSSFDSVEVARESGVERSIKLFDGLVIQSLKMFSKSSANLQTIILDMLCQLLEFNVNYMQLDAKKVFVDFVMRQLEFIEGGLVIDGLLLAPKIVQFLIYLTKLKDKKFITIPKIINIIDNLLAVTKPEVKECGIQALSVLTKELFFNKTSFKGEPEVIAASIKELNAQQEVAISMMHKFISNRIIQNNLAWIIIKSKSSESVEIIDENEVYQQLLQSMTDEPEADQQLLRYISKNIFLESKNFNALLKLYWSLLENEATEKIIVTLTAIQEQVISKTEEVCLINQVKLHQQKENSHDQNSLRSFLVLHQKVLLKLLPHIDKESLRKFLNFLAFKKFPTFYGAFQEILLLKEIVKNSAENINSLNETVCFLLSMDIKKEQIEDIIKSQENLNQQMAMEVFYKNLFEKRNDINAWENEELMDFFKDSERLEIFLLYSKNILLDSLLEDQEISRIILRKLTIVNVPIVRKKYLLENVSDECLIESMNYTIAETAHGSVNARVLQLSMLKKMHTVKNDYLMGKSNVKISTEGMEQVYKKIFELKLNNKSVVFTKSVEDFVDFIKFSKVKDNSNIELNDLKAVVDEDWLLERAKHYVSRSNNLINGRQIAEMLFEIKSESKLITLISMDDFNIKLLPSTLDVAFEKMLRSFRTDCVQINAHLNYMKISPLLKISVLVLVKNVEKLTDESEDENVSQLSWVSSIYLRWITKLYKSALIHVEAKLVEKFISENLLKNMFIVTFIKLFGILVKRLISSVELSEVSIDTIANIIQDNRLWCELNQSENQAACDLVTFIHNHLRDVLKKTNFVSRYQHPQMFDDLPTDISRRADIAKQTIFIAKIQEAYQDGEFKNIAVSSKARETLSNLLQISRNLLRLKQFYQFAATPYDILMNYRPGDDLLVMQSEGNLKLKQIPIEYLSNSEFLEAYIRRVNRYGFTERSQFEEVFMTLLVLLNQWNEMNEAEEQFNIKQLCLEMNVDLIVSCFRHPVIGTSDNSFFHFPRTEKIKLEAIGLKKLHHIQEMLDTNLNVFYQPNLERIGLNNNAISCSTFEPNQFALNYTWQMIETREEVASAGSIVSRNCSYYIEKCGIDFKSALQLIFDIMTQMIDSNEHLVLVLPQLVKLVDILDIGHDQFRWINKKMLSLYESIASEDTLSHQHIIYLLCRTAAVLVPTLNELQHLIAIINKYLGCSQLFVRSACIQGLLSLFEACCKTNTTMGAMSDEMKMLRTCIVNYTNKNGIIFERLVTIIK